MAEQTQLDKSKLLGFDLDGEPLFDIALSDKELASAGNLAKVNGGNKQGNGGKPDAMQRRKA